MRVAVPGLTLLSACGFLGIALCQNTLLSSKTLENSEKRRLAMVESLHSELVSSLNQGQNPDNRLPDPLVQSYPTDLTTKIKPVKGEHGGGIKSVLSYKEAIARTEDVMKESGLRVKVAVQASPGKCNIRYRPVIGGAELDAGQTDLSADVDPRWYVFSCDCKAPPIEQRVDCTQDKKIVFRCQ